jgi:diguanylate cyclase (GGDEF)-like protein
MLLLPTEPDAASGLLWYGVFIATEKLLLLLGALRFFGAVRLPGAVMITDRWLYSAVGLLLGWIFAYGHLGLPRLVYDPGLAAFNVLALLLLAVAVYRSRVKLPHWLKNSLCGVVLLLALHWSLLVPLYLWWLPDWRQQGFVFGTVLAMVQYLLMLSTVIVLFCRRLTESEAKALELAYQDPLTGLSNKRYVDVLFGQALQLANRPHQALAVFYIDLDKFKPINDSAGHKTGDLVLQEVARRLKASLRSTDICARIGGDEFVVIATQIEQEQYVQEIAAKLLKQLQLPVEIDGHSYELGASIGVSLHPRHGLELAELLEKADSAMYQVKQQGRNGYRLYSGEERRG